jgi:K+-sensing histidine kinase KdpD
LRPGRHPGRPGVLAGDDGLRAQDRTSRGDRLGLGLSIVQAIAGAHHATITARPRPAGGLLIEVTFPSTQTGGPSHTARGEAGQVGR